MNYIFLGNEIAFKNRDYINSFLCEERMVERELEEMDSIQIKLRDEEQLEKEDIFGRIFEIF